VSMWCQAREPSAGPRILFTSHLSFVSGLSIHLWFQAHITARHFHVLALAKCMFLFTVFRALPCAYLFVESSKDNLRYLRTHLSSYNHENQDLALSLMATICKSCGVFATWEVLRAYDGVISVPAAHGGIFAWRAWWCFSQLFEGGGVSAIRV
jgi:hypothetical protein